MDKEKLGDYRVKLKEERLKARKETDVSLQHLVSQAEVWLSLGCKSARHFCPSSMTKPTGEELVEHRKTTRNGWLQSKFCCEPPSSLNCKSVEQQLSS
jgi:hypothetical protein